MLRIASRVTGVPCEMDLASESVPSVSTVSTGMSPPADVEQAIHHAAEEAPAADGHGHCVGSRALSGGLGDNRCVAAPHGWMVEGMDAGSLGPFCEPQGIGMGLVPGCAVNDDLGLLGLDPCGGRLSGVVSGTATVTRTPSFRPA